MIVARHAEGKRGEHHYCVDARIELWSAAQVEGLGDARGRGSTERERRTPNARVGAVRCDIRGAKDEDARARANAVVRDAGMTAALARGVGEAMKKAGGTTTTKRGRRATTACVAKRRNERTGTEFWVVIARGGGEDEDEDASREMRTMSFRVGAGENAEAEARNRAAAFTASAAFDAWVRGTKCVPGPKKAGLGGSRVRAKKHPYAYSGIMGDDIIDCVCGDNEEYGFMVACETCGAWEHGECCRIYAEEEIPKDYKCSSCVRRSEKAVVLLEFASDDKAASLRTAPTPVRSPEGDEIKDDYFGTIDGIAALLKEDRIAVCCVCGCEDCDGEYGSMIRACACDSGGAIAHESCMKNWSDKYSPQKAGNGRSRTTSRTPDTVRCKSCGDVGGKASGVTEVAKLDEMLKAFGKAVDDTSSRYEAEAMAYRANPRPRPRTPVVETKPKKEKPKVEKKKVPAEKPAQTQAEAAPPTPKPSVKEEKFSGTPLSMLPLKKRRMMAWHSEQTGLSENVKHELKNNIAV